jgi:LPS sulfotransferase NodH
MLHKLETLATGQPSLPLAAAGWVWRGLPLSLKRAAYRTAMYSACALVPRRPSTVVLILSYGRTGSHLLRSYLNSLPGVGLNNEVLNVASTEGVRMRWITKRAVLRHLRVSVATSGPAVGGCKLIVQQLRDFSIQFDDIRRLFPEAKWLVSYRESLADQFVSQLVAMKTGVWLQKKSRQNGSPPIQFDVAQFKHFCAQTRAELHVLASYEWLARRALAVKYEALCKDPNGIFREAICPFIGIPPAPVSTDLVKQNTRPWEQTIENAAQVRGFFEEVTNSDSYRLADSFVEPLFAAGLLRDPESA